MQGYLTVINLVSDQRPTNKRREAEASRLLFYSLASASGHARFELRYNPYPRLPPAEGAIHSTRP